MSNEIMKFLTRFAQIKYVDAVDFHFFNPSKETVKQLRQIEKDAKTPTKIFKNLGGAVSLGDSTTSLVVVEEENEGFSEQELKQVFIMFGLDPSKVIPILHIKVRVYARYDTFEYRDERIYRINARSPVEWQDKVRDVYKHHTDLVKIDDQNGPVSPWLYGDGERMTNSENNGAS